MAVINLGKTDYKTPGKDLFEALSKIRTQGQVDRELGQADRKLAQGDVALGQEHDKLDIARQSAANQSRNLALQNKRLAYEQAKNKAELDQANKDNAYKLFEKLSLVRDNMDETGRALFDESEHTKTFTKDILKEYLPQFIGDDGKPLWVSPTDAYSKKYEALKTRLATKVAQGSANEQEVKVFSLLNGVKSDDLASITAQLLKDPNNKGLGQEGIFQRVLNIIDKKVNNFFGSTDDNINPDELA